MPRVAIKLTSTSNGGFTARKRIPADVRNDYERLFGISWEERFNSGPATSTLATAKARDWLNVIDARIANLRAERRGEGRTLTPKEADALCGEWYSWYTERQAAKHWPAEVWRDQASDVHDALSDAIREASGEPWADDTDPYSVWDENSAAREGVRPVVADYAETAQFLHAKGLVLEPAARDMFLERLIPNFFAVMRRLARNADGDYSPDKWAERFPEFERTTNDPGLRSWALFERWVAETRPAVSTVDRWRGVFLKLQSDFPEHSAAALTSEEARGWVKGLVNAERTEVTVRDVWIVACRRVFAWAVENHLLAQNPFKAVPLPVVRKTSNREDGKALAADEIKTFLKAALAIGRPKTKMEAAKRWVPWLLAYTGARAGEITQLRGADVTERDGIPAIKISPEAGTVKTKRARIVPLHEHLVEQGFLEFVRASGKGPLFYTEPSAPKESDLTNPSRPRPVTTRVHLAEWAREIGVTDPEIKPLHAWRHTFARRARQHRIDHDGTTINSICGWAQKSVAEGYGPATPQDMAEALKRFPRYEVGT
jgi:integrase